MSYIIVKPDELYHYGILGQKWGIRRFQNPDGSLTEAGKKRYLTNNGQLSEEGKKKLDTKKYEYSEHKRRWKEEGPYYYLKEKKEQLLKDARENDQYSIDYLELVPDNVMEQGSKALLKDYEKFLNDPKTYLEDRYKH